jgi:filamentous hemagglutinin
MTPAARAALSDAQSGATLYRTGQLGESMAGESQYWSLQNPLTPGYAGQMGMPGVAPDFMMGGSLNPGASVITNTARGLGANAGGGLQVITSPAGVRIEWFVMP